jgi:hypothetical protein
MLWLISPRGERASALVPRPGGRRRGALQVERQQALQRVVGRDVLGPAVGGGDGAVERLIRIR